MLCDGVERAVRFITQHLVVGQALGAVKRHVQAIPLEADLSHVRRLRVRREAAARIYHLDLHKPYDQDRSRHSIDCGCWRIDWVPSSGSTSKRRAPFGRRSGSSGGRGLRGGGRGFGVGHDRR